MKIEWTEIIFNVSKSVFQVLYRKYLFETSQVSLSAMTKFKNFTATFAVFKKVRPCVLNFLFRKIRICSTSTIFSKNNCYLIKPSGKKFDL